MSDADFIRHRALWPMWPVLPVKQRDPEHGFGRIGVIFAEENFRERSCILWFYPDQNMFGFKSDAIREKIDDIDEFVKGWKVD